MINITYTALHMRSQTEKTIFSFKDDYIDEAHTRWTYYALRYFLLKIRIPDEKSLFATLALAPLKILEMVCAHLKILKIVLTPLKLLKIFYALPP